MCGPLAAVCQQLSTTLLAEMGRVAHHCVFPYVAEIFADGEVCNLCDSLRLILVSKCQVLTHAISHRSPGSTSYQVFQGGPGPQILWASKVEGKKVNMFQKVSNLFLLSFKEHIESSLTSPCPKGQVLLHCRRCRGPSNVPVMSCSWPMPRCCTHLGAEVKAGTATEVGKLQLRHVMGNNWEESSGSHRYDKLYWQLAMPRHGSPFHVIPVTLCRLAHKAPGETDESVNLWPVQCETVMQNSQHFLLQSRNWNGASGTHTRWSLMHPRINRPIWCWMQCQNWYVNFWRLSWHVMTLPIV